MVKFESRATEALCRVRLQPPGEPRGLRARRGGRHRGGQHGGGPRERLDREHEHCGVGANLELGMEFAFYFGQISLIHTAVICFRPSVLGSYCLQGCVPVKRDVKEHQFKGQFEGMYVCVIGNSNPSSPALTSSHGSRNRTETGRVCMTWTWRMMPELRVRQGK